jgi:RNA polymerase sigma factor (sigma-70 family)
MSFTEQEIYTEVALVTALKKYDNQAYTYLYSHYRGALYNIICQFTSNKEDANDILQDIFFKIWKNIDKYNPEKGRLFTWLHTLTRNTTINFIQSKNFKIYTQNESITDVVTNVNNKNLLDQNINKIGLRNLVHQLRNEYVMVLELSYYNGLTQEEIAKTLDIPVGTVKTRLRNALIELRKKFD